MKTTQVVGKLCAVSGILGLWGTMMSCTPTSLLNFTAATSTLQAGVFGQATPLRLDMAFINNTPFRAIFTFGGYDPLDKDTVPSFSQLRLEGNSTSAQTAQNCRKTFTVGGAELIRLIETGDQPANDPRALVDGVNFSGAPLGDPLEAVATEGTAEGVVLQAGVDFGCESLIVFTFEQDATAPGGFRIDFQVTPP